MTSSEKAREEGRSMTTPTKESLEQVIVQESVILVCLDPDCYMHRPCQLCKELGARMRPLIAAALEEAREEGATRNIRINDLGDYDLDNAIERLAHDTDKKVRADERRRVYEEIEESMSLVNATGSNTFAEGYRAGVGVTLERLRRICGMEGEDD